MKSWELAKGLTPEAVRCPWQSASIRGGVGIPRHRQPHKYERLCAPRPCRAVPTHHTLPSACAQIQACTHLHTYNISPCRCCTPLPTWSPWKPPLLTSPHQLQPLPQQCHSYPKAQPFCQPRPLQVRALWGPFPIERKKERKREENQKERGKQKNEIGPKGQWCLELSHCITMNMDSIKLRSAC